MNLWWKEAPYYLRCCLTVMIRTRRGEECNKGWLRGRLGTASWSKTVHVANCWEWNGLGWTGGWGSGASVQVAQDVDTVTVCTAEHTRAAQRSLEPLTYFHTLCGAQNVITALRPEPDEFGQHLVSYVCKTKSY